MWKSTRFRVLLDRIGRAKREKKEREEGWSSRAVEASLLLEMATIWSAMERAEGSRRDRGPSAACRASRVN